ncbi:MAG TPA: tripartite tricarboxylate transporter substrate binding protein [Burkholderiales bacterium]|jgi:tripartite-type tricarboxylate transporter receptor subunit TctC|nr:tripartite tricarboxylate transporter substrate binding protein [Burkholderiales bacterium]HEV8644016.1 tripartite tricarboxylate transporter substrate binding protein [Burkholderiales bacterium]
MRLLLAGLLSLLSSLALAQGFPERAVRIIVPLPPGGSPDTIARTISHGLQGVWPQPVVVENRTGGSQNIGSDAVAKSAPDGHTWLLAPDNVFAVNPHIAKQPFDPLADLAPVTLLARIQFLLVVHPSVPAASVQELIAYAKARPGELNFGSSGTGSPQFLGGTLLQQLSGTKMNHVPYKGAAPAVADLLPGRIQVWIGAANSLLPHIREGKLRVLATAAAQRFAVIGDTPTVEEAGLAGYALYPWLGLFVPGKTPPEIIAKINAEVARVVNSPEVKARLVPQGMDIATGSPEELGQLVRDDYARWGKVMREAGIKGE